RGPYKKKPRPAGRGSMQGAKRCSAGKMRAERQGLHCVAEEPISLLQIRLRLDFGAFAGGPAPSRGPYFAQVDLVVVIAAWAIAASVDAFRLVQHPLPAAQLCHVILDRATRQAVLWIDIAEADPRPLAAVPVRDVDRRVEADPL